MSKELARYVQSLTSEGGEVSAGIFTLDYARALEKVSERLFSDSTSYLLKLIQAAVLGGSDGVEVKALQDRLEVHFRSTEFSSHRLADFPERFHLPWGQAADSAWQHLLRALHGARLRTPVVTLAVQDTEGGRSFRFEGEELTLADPGPTRSGDLSECLVCLSGGSWGPGWLEERAALQARCGLAPIPLLWNGKPVNPSVPPQISGSSKFDWLLERMIVSREEVSRLLVVPHLTSIPALVYDLGTGYTDRFSYGRTLLHQWRSFPFHTAHPLYPTTSRPEFQILESDFVQELMGLPEGAYALSHGLVRPGSLQGRGNFYQILYLANLQGLTRAPFRVRQSRFGLQRPLAVQAWLRCPPWSSEDSELQILQHGVLLDARSIELPLKGLRAYVADSEIGTDLSGLVPRRDSRWEQVVEWLVEECVKAKKELRQALRWNEKKKIPQDWVDFVTNFHRLDLDS